MVTSTNATDVVNHFTAQGAKTTALLAEWVRRPGLNHVAETVLNHTSQIPYTLAADDIANLRTEHALGKIRPAQAYSVAPIKDWYPGYAFTHLFHQMLEENQGLYTWNEFRSWSRSPEVEDRLWIPARNAIKQAVDDGHDLDDAHAAMQWRVGMFYYSFLRELYVIARFREQGLPLLCHPLADALFRADAWCGNVVVELYIPNSTFKTAEAGRKFKARAIFEDQPRFDIVELTMPTQRTFGHVHLPSPQTIDRAADHIRQALDRSQAA